jgi:nucleoside-diphosphate-sugar epimerase
MSVCSPSSDLPALVTGAAGFVGSNLVRHLAAGGQKVRAMVRDRQRAPDFPAGVEIVEADLRDGESMRRAMAGVGSVHHIAALFRQAGLPDSAYVEVNVEGVRRVFDAAIAAGIPRLIHCSTVGVLGDVQNPPGDENTPCRPGDIYQETKLQGERLALEYYRSGRIGGVVIRPAMIYGPGDTRTLKLFRMVAKGTFFYLGDGSTLLHFIDVRDLARAFELAMARTERNGEIYIIAGREATRVRELAECIAAHLGVRPPWLRLPVRPMQWLGSACEAICTPLRIPPPIFRRRVDFHVKNRSFNGSKAARELGFSVDRSFREEVPEIIASYQELGWIPRSRQTGKGTP